VTALKRVGPYFVPSVPVGVATEHEAAYSRIILNLTAMTRDADARYDAGPFRYRQATHTEVFDVQRHTGAVQARQSLDRRRTEQYNISVYVDNAASPPRTSLLVFTVSIIALWCFDGRLVRPKVQHQNRDKDRRERNRTILSTIRANENFFLKRSVFLYSDATEISEC